MINELVANAVKHSFGDGRSGRIELTGDLDDRTYRIICRDDGRVDPEPAAPNKREGLGLKVMATAVRQLDGTLVVEPTADGYVSRLEFPAVRSDA